MSFLVVISSIMLIAAWGVILAGLFPLGIVALYARGIIAPIIVCILFTAILKIREIFN